MGRQRPHAPPGGQRDGVESSAVDSTSLIAPTLCEHVLRSHHLVDAMPGTPEAVERRPYACGYVSSPADSSGCRFKWIVAATSPPHTSTMATSIMTIAEALMCRHLLS